MGILDPSVICSIFATHLPHIERPIEQFHAIMKIAVRQHALGSVYTRGDIKGGGVPRLCGQEDMPYRYISNLTPELDRECMGWPVNFAIYNGEPYLQYKWWGFELSKVSAGDNDKLMPFRVVDNMWEHTDVVGGIRDTYVMFRNLLAMGLDVSFLERKVQDGLDALKSSFAEINLENMPVLPLNIVPLVAHEGVVERVVRLGAFECMDRECQEAAERVQQYVMRSYFVPQTPMDCCSYC